MVVVALQDANCNSNSLACADHGLKFNPEDEKSNAVTGRRDGESWIVTCRLIWIDKPMDTEIGVNDFRFAGAPASTDLREKTVRLSSLF